MEAIRPNLCPSLAATEGGADQNRVSTLLRRLLTLSLAAALIGGLVVPLAGAEGPTAVAAKKGAKCKKKGAKKSRGKSKKCARSSPASQPGLPGKPLSPGTPTAPALPTVSALTVTSNPVLAGTPDSGQVTISEPAPSGGQAVTLQSGDPSRASVPASVHVAAGQTSASFAISTTAGPTVLVPIEAIISSSSRNVQLSVVEEPSVASVALDYDCFPELQTDFGVNRVTTDVPVPADTTVDLGSDNELSLTTPASVIVPEDTGGAIFDVDTLLATPLVTVTATLGTSSASDTASVRSALTPSALVDLALNPSSVLAGGTSTGTVTLDCEALAGGAVVGLSSDNPDVTVPPTVTVPNGQLSATFTITTAPSATEQAVITATLGGSQQATLLIDQLGT